VAAEIRHAGRDRLDNADRSVRQATTKRERRRILVSWSSSRVTSGELVLPGLIDMAAMDAAPCHAGLLSRLSLIGSGGAGECGFLLRLAVSPP
jgi:hypothetical protein